MQRINQNFKNLLSLFTLEFAARLISFLSVTYLARVLGASGFGLINIGFALLGYAMIISNGGLTLLGTKKIAASSADDSVVGEILFTRIITSAAVFIISIITAYYFSPADTFPLIAIFLIYLFPSAVLLEWFFHGIQKMEYIAYGKILNLLLYLFLIYSFVNKQGDEVYTAFAWLLGGVFNAAVLIYFFIKSRHKFFFQIKKFNPLKLLKESFPLGSAAVIAQFVSAFPVIFLGIYASNSDAGIFSAAHKLIILLLVLDRIFYSLFYPKIVQSIGRNSEDYKSGVDKVLRIISFIGVLAALLAIAFGGVGINFVFGDEFIEAVPLFNILLFSFYLTLVNSVFTYTLIALNRDKIYTAALLSGMIFFIASIYLLPITISPALSLVIFELISLIIMAAALSKKISLKLFRNIFIPLIILTAVYFVSLSYDAFAIQAASAAAGIVFSFFILGIKDEAEFIKKTFKLN